MNQRGFTPYKDNKSVRIKGSDLTTLIFNLWRGAADKNVGWEDAARTLDDISYNLDFYSVQKVDVLESALWSCNLLHEQGKFWDIKNRSFDEFVKVILPEFNFDKDYNFLTKKERKNKK